MTQQLNENYKSWWKPLVEAFEEDYKAVRHHKKTVLALRLDAECEFTHFRYFDEMFFGCHSGWNDALKIVINFFKELLLVRNSYFFQHDNPEKIEKMRRNARLYFSDQDIFHFMNFIVECDAFDSDLLSDVLDKLENYVYNLENIIIAQSFGESIGREYVNVDPDTGEVKNELEEWIVKDGEFHIL